MAPSRASTFTSKPPEPSTNSSANPDVLESSSSSIGCHSDSDDDDYTDNTSDPITATYNVFITPQDNPLQNLYLLQFPTRSRSQPYNELSGLPPSALRFKPETGFVELDVPIPTEVNYDAQKARKWGDALRKTGGGEGLGLSGGFVGRRGRGVDVKTEGDDEEVDEEEVAVRKQTLGGMVVKREEGGPAYMMGAFRGDELHLTPISGLIQLRPQHPHIDATAHLSRQASLLATQPTLPSSTSTQPRPTAPRAVRTTVGTTDDPYAATRRLVSAASEEPWRHLSVRDQDSERAYEIYHTRMFSNGGNEEKGREKLVSKVGREEYLDLLCEGFGGDEKGRRRARSRRRKRKGGSKAREREKGKGKAGASAEDVVAVDE